MKKIILLIITGTVLLSSCKKEEQVEDSTPTTTPTTDVRDLFVGSYSMSDSTFDRDGIFTTAKSYVLYIDKKEGAQNEIMLTNFQNHSDTIIGEIDRLNITIQPKTEGYYLRGGTGQLVQDELSVLFRTGAEQNTYAKGIKL